MHNTYPVEHLQMLTSEPTEKRTVTECIKCWPVWPGVSEKYCLSLVKINSAVEISLCEVTCAC